MSRPDKLIYWLLSVFRFLAPSQTLAKETYYIMKRDGSNALRVETSPSRAANQKVPRSSRLALEKIVSAKSPAPAVVAKQVLSVVGPDGRIVMELHRD